MTDKPDTGGTAFPFQAQSSVHTRHFGMPLLDWFAGQALKSMGMWTPKLDEAGNLYNDDEAFEARASWAFKQAEAMLAESQKRSRK